MEEDEIKNKNEDIGENEEILSDKLLAEDLDEELTIDELPV